MEERTASNEAQYDASSELNQTAAAIGFGYNGDPHSYTRQTALQQACHDLKGEKSAEDTVARAKVYFEFLKG